MPPQETILYQTIYIHMLNHFDIRHADSSLFLRKNCMALASAGQVISYPVSGTGNEIAIKEGSGGALQLTQSPSISNLKMLIRAILGWFCYDHTLNRRYMARRLSHGMAGSTACGGR
jgi:hypothetical protein